MVKQERTIWNSNFFISRRYKINLNRNLGQLILPQEYSLGWTSHRKYIEYLLQVLKFFQGLLY